MKNILVKDLMVPLSSYAVCSEEATLYEAVIALEQAQKAFQQSTYQHRAILVQNKEKKIVGKLSQLDVLRALEPRYKDIGESSSLAKTGLSPLFLRSMREHFHLWEKPLDDICKKASSIIVKDIMYSPTQGEYVKEDSTLDDAIHQLVIGHHQSLLVTRGKDIVGILRLTDVFLEICNRMKTCAI